MKTNLLEEKKGESGDNDDDEPVSFFRLFRFSSLWDKVLIFIGCIIAVSAGLAFIVMIVLIGNVLDAFVDSLLLPNYTSGTDTGISTDVADELLTEIIKFCIYYTSLGAIFFCLNVIMISSLSIAAANQAFRIKCLFMKAILHQNIGWFDTNQTGDFATLITGNLTRIQDGIGASVGICISLLSQSIFAFACAVYYGWKLSLIMMFIMVIILILTTIISKFQAKATIREKATYGLAGAVAEEVLSSIKTVAAFGGENKEIERYNSYVTRTRTQGIKRSLITSVGASILSSAFFLSCALTFWYGIILIVDGRITGDEEYKTNTLIIVSFNIMGCAQSTAQISPHLEAFNIARGSATKLFKIIERIPPLDSTSEDGDKPKSIIGDITLENVHFSYPARADVKVLQGFSLKVKSGETIALVGLSGCGKSTIVQLIQRFYDVDGGQVKIDKHDVKDLNIGWLRRHIGVVGQEPILFSTTIAENIRYGKSNASLLEIEKAAEIANAHDFISKLPKGYDTLIGSGGMQLSGGQKQRIAIARAIMKDPKILLLDEATSALDGENEYIVQTALDKARQNKTTIVIAHQLSTVRTADKIVTISGGAVKEMGTHNELMARKGLYYQLFMKQDTIEYKPPRMENTLVIPNPSLYASDDSTGSVCHGSAQRLFFAVDDPAYLNKELSTSIKPSGMRLLKFSFPELPYVSIGCVSALAAGVCPLFYGIIFGDILQLLSKDDNTILSDITYYSSIFIAISIGSGVSTFMQTLMFSIAGEGLTLRLRKKAFSAIVYQDMSWFDLPQNSVGALCSRLSSDTSDVQVVSGIRISVIMQAVSTIVSTIGIAFYFNWQLGLVALSSIPLGLLITYLENVMTSKRTLSYKTAVGEASKVAIEAIVNIRTVASLHQENIFYSQFKMALISPLRKSWTNAIVRGVVYGFARVISPFQYAATLYFGSIHVAYNNMPYGNLIKVSEVIAVGSDMIAQAVVFSPDYHKARLAAGRVFQLLDQKPKINKFSDRKEDLENWSGNIEFKNVHFKYPNRPEIKILRDFNLQIKPGQTVALVGSSGCGKSTCIQLIERFYETYQGELRADGKNIKHLQLSSLRNQVGLVSQEPVLFSESIARNIAYGDNGRDIPVAEIITAARNANIHEFISTLPQGYSTVLGEKGTQLSGGQKQRIALARALIRKPKLLLLDEATSSLDAENEKIVQEALDKASDGRTCITIAHRLSTIQNADVIAVIRKGRITERGTHQELLKLRGHYYKLYTAQDERNHQIIKS